MNTPIFKRELQLDYMHIRPNNPYSFFFLSSSPLIFLLSFCVDCPPPRGGDGDATQPFSVWLKQEVGISISLPKCL